MWPSGARFQWLTARMRLTVLCNTTVTRNHGIEYGPCKKILEVHDRIAGNKTGKLMLHFAIPDWLADNFPKQSFDGVKKHETHKQYKISGQVDQYVLKIDSKQIESLKEIFLEKEETMREEFSRRIESADYHSHHRHKRRKNDASWD